ncbi:MAG TPA: hypothetical protein VGF91_24295 [Solirubrobacteraceae bacterium]|jgi:hypothetical protein
MSDLPSALGIEAVEFVNEGGRNVTVRVTGRWRRRRPELRGQAMLVVETGTVRQRFVAMPEPPSLMGAAPGTWRMSFSVPAELAPQLPGKTFLQLGAMMVPLPVGEVPAPVGEASPPVAPVGEAPPTVGDAPGPTDVDGAPEAPGPDVLEARQLRSSELAAASARRRAAEADAAVAELVARVGEVEKELAHARADSERLTEVIAEGDRRSRLADQHVHSERALRAEIEQELRDRSRAADHERRVLQARIGDLERELARMRRTVDEAQHLAAATQAARVVPEHRPAEEPAPARPRAPVPPSLPREPPRPARLVDHTRAHRIEAELALAQNPPPAGPDPAAQATAALERELMDARRALADARRELSRQRLLCERAYDAIDHVRNELLRLGEAAAEPPPPTHAPERPEPASEPAEAERAEPVQAERLTEALARLRGGALGAPANVAPAEPAAPTAEPGPSARPTKPWLGRAFRTLTARDAPSAGRLLLALLPAQRAADPQPVAYDLVLGDLACARVTVGSAAVHVEIGNTPRPMSEVDFQLVGDLASIARLLVAGPVRRRLGGLPGGLPGRYRLARIRGDRNRLAALEKLLEAPLSISRLGTAGVRLDPVLALTVAALMIEPEWTAGERFTIGHREAPGPTPDAYLHVLAGKPPLVAAEPPHGPVATVIVCSGGELVGVLAGEPGARFSVEGEDRPLALVRQWLDRAQSG